MIYAKAPEVLGGFYMLIFLIIPWFFGIFWWSSGAGPPSNYSQKPGLTNSIATFQEIHGISFFRLSYRISEKVAHTDSLNLRFFIGTIY